MRACFLKASWLTEQRIHTSCADRKLGWGSSKSSQTCTGFIFIRNQRKNAAKNLWNKEGSPYLQLCQCTSNPYSSVYNHHWLGITCPLVYISEGIARQPPLFHNFLYSCSLPFWTFNIWYACRLKYMHSKWHTLNIMCLWLLVHITLCSILYNFAICSSMDTLNFKTDVSWFL